MAKIWNRRTQIVQEQLHAKNKSEISQMGPAIVLYSDGLAICQCFPDIFFPASHSGFHMTSLMDWSAHSSCA